MARCQRSVADCVRRYMREGQSGGGRSHVRTRLYSPNSLPTGKNREFRQICLLREILKADRRANSKALSRFPYATEQGIISEEQGILAPEQGFCLPKTEIVAG
jgi:hypothetical protein